MIMPFAPDALFLFGLGAWFAGSLLIGYGYRHVMPLGYAVAYAYAVLMGVLFVLDGARPNISLLAFVAAPFVGFIGLYYWYARPAKLLGDELSR